MGNTHQHNRFQELSSEPLLFHTVHSGNVHLSHNLRKAKRTEGVSRGVCFSSRPIGIGEIVTLLISDVTNNWSGALRIGFTVDDPAAMSEQQLNSYSSQDITNEEGYWAKAVPEHLLVKGTSLFFVVTPAGDVVFGCAGEVKGVLFGGVLTDVQLWALIDVYGNTTSVEFVDGVKLKMPHPAQQPVAANQDTEPRDAPPVTPPNVTPPKKPSRKNKESSKQQKNLRKGSYDSSVLTDPNPAMRMAELRSTPTNGLRPPVVQNSRSDPMVRRSAFEMCEPLPFHYLIGRNTCLSSGRMTASRLPEEYCNGYVFTGRPVQPGERFLISILGVDNDFAGGLAFGMTSCDPATLNVSMLPDDADHLLDRPEYWVVHKDISVRPNVGDELGFLLKSSGEVVYIRNGSRVSTLMHVDVSLNLWMFLDVYGCCTKIRSLGVVLPSLYPRNVELSASGRGKRVGANDCRHICGVSQRTVSSVATKQGELTEPSMVRQHSMPNFSRARQSLPHEPSERGQFSGRGRQSLVPTAECDLLDMGDVPLNSSSLPPPLIPVPARNPQPVKDCPPVTQSPPQKNIEEFLEALVLPSTSKAPGSAQRTPTRQRTSDSAHMQSAECAVCMERAPDSALYTCGHMCMCYSCAINLKAKDDALCPICRQPIIDVIRVFRS